MARINVNVAFKNVSLSLPVLGKLTCRDLKVASGDHVLVHGPSGRGKSTLLHLMAGLLKPQVGEIWLNNMQLTQLSTAALSRLRRCEIGFIFQHLSLLPQLTAVENICLSGASHGSTSGKEAGNILEQLGLGAYRSVPVAKLSQGQRQRVAVARVLWAKPALILADEPTSSLDDENAALVCALLRDAARKATLVVVSHDQRLKPAFPERYDIRELLK